MRVLRLALVLLLVAAAIVGTARADLFAVLPGATAPNPPGAVLLPPSLLQRPAVPERRTSEQLARLWRAAGETYKVPWDVLAAINSVESAFGRNMGPSSAGAIGWMQFMPSTWTMWGVDADGDGVANPWNPEDAIYSAARYLAAAGAPTNVHRAVFAYNHAGWYVDQVLRLASVYEAGGTQLAFGLDRLAGLLARARSRLAATSQQLERARAERIPATLASAAARTARAERIAALQAQVDAAARDLGTLQARAAGASFSPATGAALGGPILSGGYAFPVGGAASTVSVGASHHDYPAADIAAPNGAPVYALAAGTIERTWTADPRCGIGLLLRTAAGRGWVYCHLATLDAEVTPGLRVAAGDSLGLVGATGEATGPHLHLQLEHATGWPQREQWFQAFVGSAFHWQGDPPSPAPATAGSVAAAAPVDIVLFHR